MKVKFSEMQTNGKMKTKTINTNAKDLVELADMLLATGKVRVETADYDRGILLLSNGIIAEDIEKNKRYKEMLKYM